MSTDLADTADTSSLDLIVPEDSNFNIENFLQHKKRYERDEPDSQLSLSTIPQRDVLYFGMSRTPMM